MRRIERVVIEEWYAADRTGQRFFPHEFLFNVLKSGKLKQYYQIDPKDSWMLAAAEKNLPMIVPGWEDSTLGNMFAAQVISGKVKNPTTVRGGVEYMIELARWYTNGHGRRRSVSSRSAAASPEIFPFAWSPCFTRTCAAKMFHYGPISAKSAIPPPVTAPIQEPCQMKKSPGANLAWILRDSSSNRTPHRGPAGFRLGFRLVTPARRFETLRLRSPGHFLRCARLKSTVMNRQFDIALESLASREATPSSAALLLNAGSGPYALTRPPDLRHSCRQALLHRNIRLPDERP